MLDTNMYLIKMKVRKGKSKEKFQKTCVKIKISQTKNEETEIGSLGTIQKRTGN